MSEMMPYPPWRRVAQVATFLTAHRAELRPLAVQRCPVDPQATLAEVHMVEGERWLWHVGDRKTRRQLDDEGIPSEGWVKVAPSALPLEHPNWADQAVITACRKCRLTYAVSTRLLLEATEEPSPETVDAPPARRVVLR